jgi:hypothetical protein
VSGGLRGPLKCWAGASSIPAYRDGHLDADAATTKSLEHESGLQDQTPRGWRFLTSGSWQECYAPT